MSFIVARLHGTKVPPVRELPVASGQAFKTGALLIRDNNGAWVECGADPVLVGAIAESDFGVDASGFSRLGRSEFPPGMMQATKVQGEQPFHAEYVDSLPAAAGGAYGVVRDTDGRWKVDFADVVNQVVRLVNLDWTQDPLNRNRVEVVFLPGVVQII